MDPYQSLGVAVSMLQFLDHVSHLLGIGDKTMHYPWTSRQSSWSIAIKYIKDEYTRLKCSLQVLDEKSSVANQCNDIALQCIDLLVDCERNGGNLSQNTSIAQAVRIKCNKHKRQALTSGLQQSYKRINHHIEDGRAAVKAAIECVDYEKLTSTTGHDKCPGHEDELSEQPDKNDCIEPLTVRKAVSRLTPDQRLDFLDTINIILDQLQMGKELASIPVLLTNTNPLLISVTIKHNRATENAILKALKLHTMDVWKECTDLPSKGTFEWLFETDLPAEKKHDNLSHWLRHGCGIYWVEGKVGAGKSTLMNFVAKHSKTAHLLQGWSASNTLIVAPYFTWAQGNDLHRTQAGLLRSLLYSILNTRRDLISVVLPAQYDELWRKHTPWVINPNESRPNEFQLTELKQAMEHVSRLTAKRIRVCLMVDGLDEVVGTCHELTNFFKSIATQNSVVKVLIASRRDNEFDLALCGIPKMKLQDFTRTDMLSYSTRAFSTDHDLMRLVSSHPQGVRNLCESLVSRASGMFLWLRIMLHAIGRESMFCNSLPHLSELVNRCPEDLYGMYTYTLNLIQPEDRIYTSKLLQWTFRCLEVEATPPDASRLSFINVGDFSNVLSSSTLSFHSMRPVGANAQISSLVGRLGYLCCGLLMTSKPVNHNPFSTSAATVSVVHGSFLDYWKDNSLTRQCPFFETWTDSLSFDPNEGLLASIIFYFQQKYNPKRDRNGDDLVRHLNYFCLYCDKAGPELASQLYLYVEALDRTLSQRMPVETLLTQTKTSWISIYFRRTGQVWKIPHDRFSLLDFAVYANISGFVRVWMAKKSRAQSISPARQALGVLLTMVNSDPSDIMSRFEVFAMLMEAGDCNIGSEQPSGTSGTYVEREWKKLVRRSVNGDFEAESLLPSLSPLIFTDTVVDQFEQASVNDIVKSFGDYETMTIFPGLPKDLNDSPAVHSLTISEDRGADREQTRQAQSKARLLDLSKANHDSRLNADDSTVAQEAPNIHACDRCSTIQSLRDMGFSIACIYEALDNADISHDTQSIASWIVQQQHNPMTKQSKAYEKTQEIGVSVIEQNLGRMALRNRLSHIEYRAAPQVSSRPASGGTRLSVATSGRSLDGLEEVDEEEDEEEEPEVLELGRRLSPGTQTRAH